MRVGDRMNSKVLSIQYDTFTRRRPARADTSARCARRHRVTRAVVACTSRRLEWELIRGAGSGVHRLEQRRAHLRRQPTAATSTRRLTCRAHADGAAGWSGEPDLESIARAARHPPAAAGPTATSTHRLTRAARGRGGRGGSRSWSPSPRAATAPTAAAELRLHLHVVRRGRHVDGRQGAGSRTGSPSPRAATAPTSRRRCTAATSTRRLTRAARGVPRRVAFQQPPL